MSAGGSELPEARQERSFHLRSFCGREALLANVDARLRDPRGGCILLLGGPGAGKSALAAALAERHDAPFHFVKSHRNPARFVPALIRQARERSTDREASASENAGADEPLAMEPDDLRNQLVGELERLRDKRGSAVVIIDALDELDATSSLSFLPMHVPRNVHVVLTARPDIPLVAALRARIPELEEITVPSLSVEDVRAVWQRSLGQVPALVDLELLVQRTQGNALLVSRALARAKQQDERLDPATVASTLHHLFDEIYREIESKTGAVGARIAELFSIAREPLTPPQIGLLLAQEDSSAAIDSVRDVVDAMSEFLLDDGRGGFQPWHRGFADFVRAEVLGSEGVRRTHALFASWAGTHRPEAIGYGLRHRVAHLTEAGDLDAARVVLEDLTELERRLEAGLVAELILDLDRVASPWVEVLRRHAHFLSRRPTALRTVLDHEGLLRKSVYPSVRPPHSPWIATLLRPLTTSSLPTFILRGHDDEVLALAIDAAGARVASASADGTVRVWDAPTTKEIARAKLSAKRVLAVAFSRDGATIACGTDDRGVVVLDANLRSEERAIAHPAPVWAVAFAATGRLATGARDGVVRVFDVSGSEVWQASAGGVVTSLSFSTDGATLAASATRGRLVLFSDVGRGAPWAAQWDGATLGGRVLASADDDTVWAVAHAARADRMATVSAEGLLRLYDVHGHELASATVSGERLYTVALAPDGSAVACAGTSGKLHLFREKLGANALELAPLAIIRAHASWVDCVAFTPRGDAVVTASVDRTLRAFAVPGAPAALELHDVEAGPVSSPSPHEAPASGRADARASCCAFSHHAESVAVGRFDGTLSVYSFRDARERARVTAHDARILAIAFSPSDRILATGAQDGSARLFKLKVDDGSLSLARIATLRGHEAAVTAIVFSPITGRVATGSRDQIVRIFSIFGSREVARMSHDGTVTHLAASSTGELLAASSSSGTVRVWSFAEPRDEPLFEWRDAGHVESLEVHDGFVAVRTREGELHVRAFGADTPEPADLVAELVLASRGVDLVSGASPRAATLGIAPYESAVVDMRSGAVLAAYPAAFSFIAGARTAPAWVALDDARVYMLTLSEPRREASVIDGKASIPD